MVYSSFDNMISLMTQSLQTRTFDFHKSFTATSQGNSYFQCLGMSGNPAAATFSGSAGVAVALNSSTLGAIPLDEGNVSPSTRNLLNITGLPTTGTTIQPQQYYLYLCDYLLCYPSLVITGTPTTLNNTVTLPRYASGQGVSAICSIHNTVGFTATALTFSYTGADNNTYTSVQTNAAGGNAAPNTLFTNNGSPFFIPTAGIQGIKSVNSYTISSGTTGTVDVMLVKVLAQIPLFYTGLPGKRETVYQVGNLPQIQDNACLGFLLSTQGGTSVATGFMGSLQYLWGP